MTVDAAMNELSGVNSLGWLDFRQRFRSQVAGDAAGDDVVGTGFGVRGALAIGG